MRVLAPWRQRAAVAPGGAAAEEGQPLEARVGRGGRRRPRRGGAAPRGRAEVGRPGDLIEEAGLVAAAAAAAPRAAGAGSAGAPDYRDGGGRRRGAGVAVL